MSYRISKGVGTQKVPKHRRRYQGSSSTGLFGGSFFGRGYFGGGFFGGGFQRDAFQVGSGILLQALIVPGQQNDQGQLVLAAAVPWFKIVELLKRDPEAAHQIHWRKWEEIIAAAYSEQGFEVLLTPRSGDRGRDVIATLPGIGSIRYFDQVKAYKPGNLVTAQEVQAMLGVLSSQGNVSKGIVTTTSDFAPGIFQDESIARLMPYRLELKPRAVLLEWLAKIAASRKKG